MLYKNKLIEQAFLGADGNSLERLAVKVTIYKAIFWFSLNYILDHFLGMIYLALWIPSPGRQASKLATKHSRTPMRKQPDLCLTFTASIKYKMVFGVQITYTDILCTILKA